MEMHYISQRSPNCIVVVGVLVHVIAGHEGYVETVRVVVPTQPDSEVQVGGIGWRSPLFCKIQEGHGRISE